MYSALRYVDCYTVTMDYNLLLIITLFLLLPGLFGVLLPAMPGVPYMFMVVLIFGVVDKFAHLSSRELFILGGIALASIVVDYLSGLIGAKFGGASLRSMASGLLGLIIGILLLPPLGGLVGLFIGILASEFYLRGNQRQALRAATGGLIGSVVGIAINLVLALGFIITFIFFALR